METFDYLLITAWSLACLVATAGVIGLLFHDQLTRWSTRLRAALVFPAQHRRIKESTVAAMPAPVTHPSDDLPEHIRAMIARKQKPAAEGRGRRWAEDVLHGETGMHPVVVLEITAAPEAEVREMAEVSA